MVYIVELLAECRNDKTNDEMEITLIVAFKNENDFIDAKNTDFRSISLKFNETLNKLYPGFKVSSKIEAIEIYDDITSIEDYRNEYKSNVDLYLF